MKSLSLKLLCTYALLASVPASAFELIHNDYGSQFYFVFDGGTNEGVKENMTACVDDQNGKELYCGKVEHVNPTKSGVYAPAQQEAFLEIGYNVRVVELGDIPGNRPRLRSSREGLSIGGSFQNFVPMSQRPTTWNSTYTMTPLLPFQYKHADFSIDARMSGEGPIWTEGRPVRRSLVGASITRRSPLSNILDHEFGFTWRYIAPVKKDVDYDPNSASVYARESSKVTDLTLAWTALSAGKKNGIYPGWQAGAGLEYLNLKYTSSVIDENSGGQTSDLASSSANLIGLFFKAGGRVEKAWGKSSRNGARGTSGVAVNGILPIYSTTRWTHGDHNLASDTTQRRASQTQLEDATDLKKASLGFESSIYLGWMF